MMTDYESNMIKPVDGLQNVTGLAPTRRREERSRRQQLQQENENKEEQESNELVDEQVTENPQKDWDENEKRSGNTGIDYRA